MRAPAARDLVGLVKAPGRQFFQRSAQSARRRFGQRRPSSPRRRCRCCRRRFACDLRSLSTCRRARCTSCTPDICSCKRGADNDMLRCARGVYVHVHTRSRARARSAREASGVRTPHSCADDGCFTRHRLHTLHAAWRFFQSCNPRRRPGARAASSGRLLFARGAFPLNVRATARTRRRGVAARQPQPPLALAPRPPPDRRHTARVRVV